MPNLPHPTKHVKVNMLCECSTLVMLYVNCICQDKKNFECPPIEEYPIVSQTYINFSQRLLRFINDYCCKCSHTVLIVLIPQAVAWLRCYYALQERVPKRWAPSCHCLTNPFDHFQNLARFPGCEFSGRRFP